MKIYDDTTEMKTNPKQTQFFGLVNRAGKMLWVVFWILSFGDSDLFRI
jgi:hypothetical protein